jgi:F420-non-reducing hydrogenase small subunit
MDCKYDRLETLADGEIALSVLYGNVRNSDQLRLARLLRQKSRVVLGFGSCACFGGVAGLANLCPDDDIISWVYRDAPTVVNPTGTTPQTVYAVGGEHLTLPAFFHHVYALSQVITVDYYLPGCPPPSDLVAKALFAALAGKLPLRAATLAPQKPLCDACPRNRTKPSRLEIAAVQRVHEVELASDECFLANGVICLGPATRSGCGGTCLTVNLPCRGCFGPVDEGLDAGTRFLSAFAALMPAASAAEVHALVDSICDPVGCCYRFTEPVSLLGQKTLPEVKE